MPLSLYALDNFVAQDLSKLTECRLVSVADDFPDHASWLSLFVLTWMLRIRVPKEKAALAFALIRRAESAIEDYEAARAHLADLVKGGQNISLYFRCLRRLDSTVAMVYQALDFSRKAVKKDLFAPGDGSPCQRLNRIYNESRHADPETLPSGQLHAVWIKNDGLYMNGVNLTFAELRELVCGIGRIADKLAKGDVPED